MQSEKSSVKGCLLLLLTAFIWGTAFIAQSKGMETMSPFTFNGIRTLLGAMVLFPFVLFKCRAKRKEGQKPLSKKLFLGGICCGVALAAASNIQQYGIKYSTVGKVGFITSLYIILVPILGIFLKKRVRWITWLCVILAVFGLYLLCIQGESGINIGDLFAFICAVLFAVHMQLVDYFVEDLDGVLLAFIQFIVAGIIGTGCAFIFENPTWAGITGGGISILYAGVMSTGVAYTLQIVGQKTVNPTTAAMICSMESVFCAIAGYVALTIGFLPNEKPMTPTQILGCVIVFSAIIIVQLPSKQKNKTT